MDAFRENREFKESPPKFRDFREFIESSGRDREHTVFREFRYFIYKFLTTALTVPHHFLSIQ